MTAGLSQTNTRESFRADRKYDGYRVIKMCIGGVGEHTSKVSMVDLRDLDRNTSSLGRISIASFFK